MAWALNLLGFCLFACAPETPFSCVGLVACRLPSLTLRKGLPCLRRLFFFVILVGSKSNVSAVFWLRFRMVWALYFFLFIFLFSGFQKRRFGILLAAVSQWLRHKTYWGSAFSHARPKHLFLEFGLVTCRFFFVFRRVQKQRFGSFLAAVSHGLGPISFFLMGSNSDVSAFFRLRFRNGLGTKPAGVLPFRMRVPNTFFLSLAWWLAGFQVLRCAKVCLA